MARSKALCSLVLAFKGFYIALYTPIEPFEGLNIRSSHAAARRDGQIGCADRRLNSFVGDRCKSPAARADP